MRLVALVSIWSVMSACTEQGVDSSHSEAEARSARAPAWGAGGTRTPRGPREHREHRTEPIELPPEEEAQWAYADLDMDGFGGEWVQVGGMTASSAGVGYADVGGDCNDYDANVYPGAADQWYDSVDSNCDSAPDFDQDQDGYPIGIDCLDESATVYPGALDTPYDGIDADCDGTSDYDADKDGFDLIVDCDDGNPTIHPGAIEIFGDGIDQNCVDDEQLPLSQVVAGVYFSCGLSETSVECWGNDDDGIVSDAPTGHFVSIMAGAHHACALTALGNSTCWGRDLYGETETPVGETFKQLSGGRTIPAGSRPTTL